MSQRRPRDKEQTIDDIMTAATSLFSERGLHGTSIRDIEKASRVSKGLILHHFESKEILYAAVQERLAREYFADMDPVRQSGQGLKGMIDAAVRRSFLHTKRNRAYWRMSMWSYLEGQPLDPELEKGFTQYLVEAMRAGQKAGLVREDIEATVMPFIIKGAIEYWLRKEALIQSISSGENDRRSNSIGRRRPEGTPLEDPDQDDDAKDELSDELLIDSLTKLFVK